MSAKRNKRLRQVRTLPAIRVTLDYENLDQWNTPGKYKGNEIIGRDGKPLSFEEYKRSYGDPSKYVSLCALVERQCDMGEWHVVDSLGGIAFPADETDTWTTGTFYAADLSELPDRAGLRQIIADLIRGSLVPVR